MSYSRNDGNIIDKDEARTPPPIFKPLDNEFHFEVDVAATAQNALCPLFITKEQDALSVDWKDLGKKIFYGNPPYSTGKILAFCIKAYEESIRGATVVLLIQSDTSTEYHYFCHLFAKEIRYLKPRVKFNNPDGTPMPGSPQVGSMVVVFQEHRGVVKTSILEWKKDQSKNASAGCSNS